MPKGDANRTWFPEMLDQLRCRWRLDLSPAELIPLRDELDAMLHRIRSERHIHSPIFNCPHCGHVGEGAAPFVTVRAMILSLARFDIATAHQVKELEKSWAEYRKANGLDPCGKPRGPRLDERGGSRAS